MDENAQSSAEFILLFGGIFVVVLLAIYMYNNYINDFGSEMASKEVNDLNNELANINNYFR